jgi:hypothetical protein
MFRIGRGISWESGKDRTASVKPRIDCSRGRPADLKTSGAEISRVPDRKHLANARVRISVMTASDIDKKKLHCQVRRDGLKI